MSETLDPNMLQPAVGIVRFMETHDATALADVFAADDVTLLDSFSPYFFEGPAAARDWASAFLVHAKDMLNLRHSFGEPFEFSMSNGQVFFSLPVRWTGTVKSHPFDETGGLALRLVNQGEGWRVKNYAWAVTSFICK